MGPIFNNRKQIMNKVIVWNSFIVIQYSFLTHYRLI
jgi:hypothetical protein